MSESFFSNEQKLYNVATRDHWREFSTHREKISRLLKVKELAGKRLGVVGAGNCNDLDLVKLADHYASLVLLDLDLSAMQEGVRRQFPNEVPYNIVLDAFEVTGALERFDAIKATTDESQRETIIHELLEILEKTAVYEHPSVPFDVVVSACILSQLIGIVVTSVGESHPQFLALVQAVRRQHLRWLVQHTAPGGWLIVLLDFVSSDSAPEIVTATERELTKIAQSLIGARNFFTGMNPAVINQAISDPLVSGDCLDSIHWMDCWRWNLGPRVYLTTALIAKKKGVCRKKDRNPLQS
jgi:hypothetical protein